MNNIRMPNSVHEDFAVEVSAQTLRRIRDKLHEVSRGKFSPAELSLTGASLAAGGIFTAAQSGVSPSTNSLWWLFYCILPAIASGCIVNFFRQKSRSEPAGIARDLLKDFPDPDEAIPEDMERLAGTWNLESTTATSDKSSTGTINFDVSRGRLSAAGLMYGEQGTPIAGIASEICDFQPRTKQFILIYRLTAVHDDGTTRMGLCILSGILLDNDSANNLVVRGTWFHLEAGPTGTRPWGTATLKQIGTPGP